MSNYPKWWDTTLTIYNKFQDPQTDIITWYRTNIDKCFWKNTNNKVTINNTILDSNNIICRIPENDKYLDRYLWEQKPNDEMGNYFTIGIGDIIIKGNIDIEINEYKNGQHSSDIINKFKQLQGCMVVEAMTNNSGLARNNKHYYVSGK